MKSVRLQRCLYFVLLFLSLTPLKAQLGPGGVGTLTNTQLWLRSDSLVAIQPLYLVTGWYDLSGHMRDFGAVTMGQTVPTLTLNAVNGHPAVKFTDKTGIGGDFLGYMGSPGISGTDAATVVIVARNDSPADEQKGGLYMGQRNVGGANAVRSYGLEHKDAVRFNGESQVFNDGHTTGDWKIVCYTNPAGAPVSAYSAYLNGTALTGGSASSVVPSLIPGVTLLGATQMNGTYNPEGFFNGEMTEVVLFSSQLNDAERVVLHNNLGARYLIPIADDHFAWELTHSHDVSGIAATNGTTFTNPHSTDMLHLSSPEHLSEGEYLFFGHDRGDARTWSSDEVPAPGTRRLAREWRFDETGDVGKVTVTIPASSLPALPAGYPMVGILIDDDGDFTSGATMYRTTLSGGVYIAEIDIDDGQYLSIIAFRPEVNFTPVAGSGDESVTNVTIEVSLNYPHTSDVTFDYAPSGGTATPGEDYILSPGTLTIPAGELTGSFTMTIIDDHQVEPTETIIITLANPSAGVTIGADDTYTYTIIDNDFVSVSFTDATASGPEGDTPGPVTEPQIIISGGIISQPGSVRLTVNNGTASSSDWLQTNSLITIAAGDYTTPVSIPIPDAALTIIGDKVIEPDETITLTLTSFVTVIAGDIVSSVYTILNDDDATVSVTATTPSVIEGGPGEAGSGSFLFTFTNPASTARTVSYTVGGTATSGTDYAALPGSFVMPAGTTEYTLPFTVIADLIVEGDESVTITITGVSGAPAVTVDPAIATIIIVDDDLPVILYTPLSVNIEEGGEATIEVWLERAPAGEVIIDIATAGTGLLTFAPAALTFNTANFATRQVITLQASENHILGSMSDMVVLSVNQAHSFGPFLSLPDIEIPVNIEDNDVAAIVVDPSSVSVEENGTATFGVSLSAAPPAGSVVINLISNDVSVVTIDVTELTFTGADWDTPKIVTVTGVDNNIIPDQSTTIALTINDGLSYDGYHGVTAMVNVNVLNDDTAGFIVTPLSLTIDEGGLAGLFTIVLTARPLSDVVFDLVNPSPVHVTNVSGVTFTPGNWDIPVEVEVTAIDDDLDLERIDTIIVAVNKTLTDTHFTDMLPQEVIITIKDNDPPGITGCPADLIISNEPGLCSAVVNWIPPLSTAPMISSHLPGTTFPVGVTVVTYISTDADGLVSTCQFSITVIDTETPVVSCKDDVKVELDASGHAVINPSDLLSAAPSDNCAVASIVLSRTEFDCNDPGEVTVKVTVTDASGNVTECDVTVIITDPFASSLSAGPDSEICVDEPSYVIAGSSASNMVLSWSSSGSGAFDDPTALHPVYTRGPTDLTEVTLTLTGTKINGCPETTVDEMKLSFVPLPEADAGSDKSLCAGTAAVSLSDAGAANGDIMWSSSGNGTFSDPTQINPLYLFGSAESDPVILTLTVTSSICGTATDNVVISFVTAPVADAGADGSVCHGLPGYQVTGASHSGGVVSWSSSGDGTFDDNTTDNPYYTFGVSDQAEGAVILVMTVDGGDACGTVSSQALITINDPPVIKVRSHTQITCNGLTDGMVRLTATEGMEPYMFSIDGSTFQISGDFPGLAAGSYQFVVIDGNGCLADTILSISEPQPFTAMIESITDVSCNGLSDGAINATFSGGTMPYGITWTGPDGFTASTASITGLAAGTYLLSVTDLHGCEEYSFIEVISEPEAIEITSVVMSDQRGYGVLCPGSSDGFIEITATGGTPPLSYRWEGPGGFTSDQPSISLIAAGLYTVTISDAAGCSVSSIYNLTAPPEILVTANVTDASCPGTPDGSIDLTVLGGSGTLSYLWSDGVTTADRAALLPGDYLVEITDENGCTYSYSVTVGVTGINCLEVYEIITPNGDGKNDTWYLRNGELYPNAEIFVYNRWGKLVYHSRNATDQWDGTYKGKVLPNDSYHYVIHLNDGTEPRTGIITIISK